MFELMKRCLQGATGPSWGRKIPNQFWPAFLGISALMLIWIMNSIDHVGEPAKPFYTYYFMVDIAKVCEEYKSYIGDWPRSMSQMKYKFGSGPARDAWNNEIIFVPYDEKMGYGELISFGRDGVPGGDGLDRDWVLRFPIKENYDWDKMQATDATNIRGSTNCDWFDGRVSGKAL